MRRLENPMFCRNFLDQVMSIYSKLDLTELMAEFKNYDEHNSSVATIATNIAGWYANKLFSPDFVNNNFQLFLPDDILLQPSLDGALNGWILRRIKAIFVLNGEQEVLNIFIDALKLYFDGELPDELNKFSSLSDLAAKLGAFIEEKGKEIAGSIFGIFPYKDKYYSNAKELKTSLLLERLTWLLTVHTPSATVPSSVAVQPEYRHYLAALISRDHLALSEHKEGIYSNKGTLYGIALLAEWERLSKIAEKVEKKGLRTTL